MRCYLVSSTSLVSEPLLYPLSDFQPGMNTIIFVEEEGVRLIKPGEKGKHPTTGKCPGTTVKWEIFLCSTCWCFQKKDSRDDMTVIIYGINSPYVLIFRHCFKCFIFAFMYLKYFCFHVVLNSFQKTEHWRNWVEKIHLTNCPEKILAKKGAISYW